MTETPDVAVLAAQLNAHLVECTNAHERVQETLNSIFSLMWKAVAALVSVLIALVAFMAVQLYTVQLEKVHQLEAAAIAAAAAKHP